MQDLLRIGPGTIQRCRHCEPPCELGSSWVRLFDRQRRVAWICGANEGIPVAEMLGARCEDLVVEEDRELMLQVCEEVLVRGESTYALIRDKWLRKWWLCSASPALSLGNELGAVAVNRHVCAAFFRLSAGQRLALSQLAHGLSVDEAVEKLQISANTFRTQLRRARLATRTATLHELTVWSLHHRELLAHYRGEQWLRQGGA